MKYIKRIAVILLIAIISLCAVFYSYYGIKNGAVVFAEDINFMTDEELESAYQAYLQSKGGGYLGNAGARLAYTNGKMLNFLTSSANTTPYKNINDIKGLMSWQKSELESGNSSVLQLVMSTGGVSVFSLYTQWLLQNKYFGNGTTLDDETGLFDTGTDDTIYSGRLFDGNLAYVIPSSVGGNNAITNFQVGTPVHDLVGNSFTINETYTYTYNNSTYSLGCFKADSNYIYTNSPYYTSKHADIKILTRYEYTFTTANVMYSASKNVGVGNDAIIYTTNNNKYYYGTVNKLYNSNTLYAECIYEITDVSGDKEVSINFYTNNNLNITEYPDIEAEGNLYITPKVKINGEYKPYIINEGDTINNVINNYYNDSGDKDKTIAEPSNNPDSGGGGGNNPSGGTLPNWNNPYPNLSPDGDGGFNFNFSLPDLNIDWNISGLTEKFPFSIPFDFIAFCRVLNAEPQTPEWSGTLTLPMVNYPFTFSLQQFDNVASLLRNMEFIGFCIALILATRALIKG